MLVDLEQAEVIVVDPVSVARNRYLGLAGLRLPIACDCRWCQWMMREVEARSVVLDLAVAEAHPLRIDRWYPSIREPLTIEIVSLGRSEMS